ncbi:MAG: ABC transporter ATP-binding protein [Phycisphaerae bacterium]|nr:ABC transporter ATP-binding protein [Phycisphaerae bacterium]
MTNLIQIDNLHVQFKMREGLVRAVNGVTFNIPRNSTIGIVGESGCGKSITAKAIMQILPPKAEITQGSILLAPRDDDKNAQPVELTRLNPNSKQIRRIRGRDVSMIFQEPMTSFSPVHTIGNQISEAILLHQDKTKKEAHQNTIELLQLAHVPMAKQRVDAYPHELSGGLRQRCMIAMALACHPRLLIADEPTTALDVTIQAQILNLIEQLQKDLGMSVMMITHDLGVIAETADEVAVMYLGRVVEQAPVKDIFDNPKHPYTNGLLASIPRMGQTRADKRLVSIRGSIPDPFSVPVGCPYHPRCDSFMEGICDAGPCPPLRQIDPSSPHMAACFLYPACRDVLDETETGDIPPAADNNSKAELHT